MAYAAGTFHRIQVKYRSARAGAVRLNFRSTWADRHGAHSTPIDKDAIDVICIYCPDTDHGVSVNLRITPTKNGQQKRILAAASFRDLPDKHLPPIDETRTSA